MKFTPKIYEWIWIFLEKNLWILRKITHQNQNQHITICPCIKFQSIWRTLDFGTKFVQKNMTGKNFERINIKIVISIQQFTPVRNFSHLVELQIMGPNLPKNIGVTKILEFQVVPCFSKYGDPVSCDLFHTSWFVFFYLSFLNT